MVQFSFFPEIKEEIKRRFFIPWFILKAYLRHPEGIPWRVKRKSGSIETKMKQEKKHEFPPVLLLLLKWRLSLMTVSWWLTSMLSERQMSCQIRDDAGDEEEGRLHGWVQFLEMIKFTFSLSSERLIGETRKWRFFDLKDGTQFHSDLKHKTMTMMTKKSPWIRDSPSLEMSAKSLCSDFPDDEVEKKTKRNRKIPREKRGSWNFYTS